MIPGVRREKSDYLRLLAVLGESSSLDEAAAKLTASGWQTSPRSLRDLFATGRQRFPELDLKTPGYYLKKTGQVPVIQKSEPHGVTGSIPSRVSSASSDRPATPGSFSSVSTADRSFVMPAESKVPTGLPLSQYGRTTFVISDMHMPFHDREVWATKMAMIRFLRPENVVIVGDLLDCYAVSFFPKDPGRKTRILDELNDALPCLDELESLRVPNVIVLEGNHEERLRRLVIGQVPALDGMVKTIPEILRIKERGWTWVPYKHSFSIGAMRYSHDFSRFGINAARQALLDVGRNVTFGHSHRLGIAYQGQIEDDGHVAMNVGWGGDFEQVDYAHRDRARRDWMHGCGIVDEDENGHVWPQAVAIINGAAKVRGQKVAA